MSLADDARLAALVGGIRDVFYVLDRDWRVVHANEMSETYFGQPRSKVLGQSLWDLFPGVERSPFISLLRRAMDEGAAGHLTRPSENQPGHFQEYRVAPLGEEGLTVCVVDVTERVLAENELLRYRERLDLAVGAHAIGIFDHDLTSDVASWSEELEAIFGLPPGGFRGTEEDFERRVIPQDFARLKALTDAAKVEGRDLLKSEFRIVRADGTIRWIETAARLIFDPDGVALRIVGTNIDITEKKAAEQHQKLLINELNHRVKNTLAIVQAVARQSFRQSDPESRAAFDGRLMALAAAHDVLTEADWEGGSIAKILAGAMAPHDPGDGRLRAHGPAVNLGPKTSVALSLAMHELATNAAKYGALSNPDGWVEVTWTVEEDLLKLTWTETGGPAIATPVRPGFGSRLLTRGLSAELGGKVELNFEPTGVVCRVEARLG